MRPHELINNQYRILKTLLLLWRILKMRYQHLFGHHNIIFKDLLTLQKSPVTIFKQLISAKVYMNLMYWFYGGTKLWEI